MLRAIWGCWLASAVCVAQGQPAAAPDALAVAMAAADASARALDYRASLERLAEAAAVATPELLPLIKRRQVLYERFLAMDGLVALARDNPERLVGVGATRGGRLLAGLVQVFELGVTPGAAIGNRLPDKGQLLLRTQDGAARPLPAEQIAHVQVQWQSPEPTAGRLTWTIASVRVVLQSGEEVVGTPTWVMCMGSMSFRPASAEEDTNVAALPLIGKEFDPSNLAAELLLLGAPPGPPLEGRIGDTEEAAAAAEGGPAYSPSAATDSKDPIGPTGGMPEPSATKEQCPASGATQPPKEETEHE